MFNKTKRIEELTQSNEHQQKQIERLKDEVDTLQRKIRDYQTNIEALEQGMVSQHIRGRCQVDERFQHIQKDLRMGDRMSATALIISIIVAIFMFIQLIF